MNENPDKPSFLTTEPGSQGRIAGVLQWLGSHELPVLLALFAILGALWGFAELAEEVMEGDTHEVDQALLLSMRNPADLSDPIGPGWVEEIGRDITDTLDHRGGGLPVVGRQTSHGRGINSGHTGCVGREYVVEEHHRP